MILYIVEFQDFPESKCYILASSFENCIEKYGNWLKTVFDIDINNCSSKVLKIHETNENAFY